MTTELSQLVRQRRKQLGLSQTQAATRAGISRRAWSEIELDHRPGAPETLAKIDVALELPEGSLLALRVQPADQGLAAIRQELVTMINTLTTREELELTKLDMIRRRHAVLTAQLRALEAEHGDDPVDAVS
jgi:transcriptional regulator with XRE-family HTH domain